MVFEYIQERFRTAYKYFACPQRRHGGGPLRGHQGRQSPEAEELGGETPVRNEDEQVKDDLSSRLTGLAEEDGGSRPSTMKGEKTLDTGLKDMVLRDESKPPPSPNGLLDSEEELGSVTPQDIPADHLHYVFDKMIFTGGKVNVTSSDLSGHETFRKHQLPHNC